MIMFDKLGRIGEEAALAISRYYPGFNQKEVRKTTK
jgi:hypothetical protein